MSEKEPYHDHDRADPDVVSLWMIVLSLFVAGVAIFIAVTVLMHHFKKQGSAITPGFQRIPITTVRNFTGPKLEVNLAADLARLRAAEKTELSTYGWVDPAAGIVHIPIDRAMRLLVQRGLPDVGSGQTPLSMQQARPSETASPSRLLENQ